jgi:hypothetical protein
MCPLDVLQDLGVAAPGTDDDVAGVLVSRNR